MKNTIVNYDKRVVGDYIVADYTSKNFKDISTYMDSVDRSMFDHYVMQDDDKLERIALELYGIADYWDILLLINFRDPLFELPLNFDTLSNMADAKAATYKSDVYTGEMGDSTLALLAETFLAEMDKTNGDYSVLKIIKPSRIYEFLQGGYEGGYF